MAGRVRKKIYPNLATSGYRYRVRPTSKWGWGSWNSRSGRTHRANYREMQDVVHTFPYSDGYLRNFKFKGLPARMTGHTQQIDQYGGAKSEAIHTNTALYYVHWNASDCGHLPVGISDVASDYINAALAKDNPGSPTVDLAAFIYELRELPELVRTLVNFTKHLPSLPISYTFGVKPLINDLRSLISLANSVQNRMAKLEKLSKGVQSDRYTLASAKSKSTYMHPMDLNYTGIYLRKDTRTLRRVWCVKKHGINRGSPLKPPRRQDLRHVTRLVYSNTGLGTLWELLPWSWLVDYFVGIQEMIDASHGNRIPGYYVSSLNIMIETKTHADYVQRARASDWTGGTFLPGYYDRVSQKRDVFLDPSPTFPRLIGLLSDGQISTLLQLAVSLASNRKRVKSLTRTL